MSFQKEDLDQVIKLSYLNCSDSEKEDILGKMQKIIAHMDRLSRLDLSDETLHAVGDEMPLREDIATRREINIEKNAPEFESNCFRVPRILES